MTHISEEILMAYADGELDADEARRVEGALEKDDALRAKLRQHYALKAEIDNAFAALDDMAMPTAVTDLLEEPSETAEVVAFPKSKWKRALQPFAIAATVLFGVAISLNVFDQSELGEGDMPSDLEMALNSLEARAGSLYQVRDSYLNHDGKFCRTYAETPDSDAPAKLNLACKRDGAWVLLASSPIKPEGAYMPAGERVETGVEAITSGWVKLEKDQIKQYLEN